MSKDPNKEDISSLIKLVDEKYKRNIRDIFRNPYFGTLLVMLFLMFAAEIYMLSTKNLGEQLNILIPLIALLVAFLAVFETKTYDVSITTNYERLSKDKIVNENNKPLLGALIIMKSQKDKISLRQIYEMNPTMFTRKKLLERLYE